MCRIRTWLASICLLIGLGVSTQAAELIMLEQEACEWCELWNEKIGPIYPITEEGRRAPLRRVDIHDPMPADLANVRSDVFTPTFILVDEGKEIGRIRGYPGEDFFWGLLARLFTDLDEAQAKAANSNAQAAAQQ